MTATPGPPATGKDAGGKAATHAAQPAGFDPLDPLDDLLSAVGLSRTDAGASVTFAGQDPIVPAAHRLGACIGVPLMAGAVAAVALHRHRGGPAQDLHLDLRQAVHTINPGAFWHPTLAGEGAPHPLVLDNPFLVTPHRTADGRWVMASAVYPHLVAKWCRFLDVPPDTARVAAAVGAWDAFELEEAAGAKGLPICVVRTPAEWLAHEQGALLAAQPVIGIERIGDAPARDFGAAERPFEASRLSFTHAVAARPSGGLAEHGADVLCATRPNDYEHEFIYAEANVGSRSAYVDLDGPTGKERAATLLNEADVVVNNHRMGTLERRGLDPRQLAERLPRPRLRLGQLLRPERPVGRTGGIRHERLRRLGPHDHRGRRGPAPASRHRSPQRLHHRLHGGHRSHGRAGQARHRRWLVARDREPDEDGDVVRVARPRRPCARRL